MYIEWYGDSHSEISKKLVYVRSMEFTNQEMGLTKSCTLVKCYNESIISLSNRIEASK